MNFGKNHAPMTIDETFFINHKLLGSVFHSGGMICCTIHSSATCEVKTYHHLICQDLLLKPVFTYTAVLVGSFQFVSYVISLHLQLNDHNNIQLY